MPPVCKAIFCLARDCTDQIDWQEDLELNLLSKDTRRQYMLDVLFLLVTEGAMLRMGKS
uniref:Uncharacterized protein n=1 Tax=Arundo donax TaxID=35708 RepID=A0A0A8Y6X8_ARUDO